MEILLSTLGGIVPTIIWLWFWLKEDAKRPEPKRYIILSFLSGMLAALLVLPLETFILNNTIRYSLFSIILLSASEELFKFFSAYFSALKNKYNDEPIDAVIYMITVALGFAAAENSLYLWQSFSNGAMIQGIIMTNMRFIGATVLHIASSGMIGMMFSLSYYKDKAIKYLSLIVGVILSIILHTIFNFSIINSNGENTLNVFMFIWLSVTALLLVIEKIKSLKPTN